MRSAKSYASNDALGIAAPNGLADDLLNGAEEIAAFFGLRPRQVFHLAAKKELPGVFKLGARLFCSKNAARAAIAAKAMEVR